jgi:hypothetical protein
MFLFEHFSPALNKQIEKSSKIIGELRRKQGEYHRISAELKQQQQLECERMGIAVRKKSRKNLTNPKSHIT